MGYLELTLAFDPSVVVPEPASLALTGGGLIVVLGYSRGRRRRVAG